METKVSEKAIFRDYTAIPLNSKVTFIPKEYTRYNADNFSTYSTDDTKFVNGILKTKVESLGGYGGIVTYTVKLDDSDEIITITSTPRSYYFKLNPQPSSGVGGGGGGSKIGGKRKSRRQKSRRQKKCRKSRRLVK